MTLDTFSLSKSQLLHLSNRLRSKCDAISEVLSQQGVNESPEQTNPLAPHLGNIFLLPMPPESVIRPGLCLLRWRQCIFPHNISINEWFSFIGFLFSKGD